MKQLNVTPSFPILNSKESDVNVPGSLGKFSRVDNGDSRFIIFIDWSRTILREAQFRHDGSDVSCSLSSSYSSNKLSLSGTQSHDRLSFGSINEGTTGIGECIAGGGASLLWIISICSIYLADKPVGLSSFWVHREIIIHGNWLSSTFRKFSPRS